MPLYDIIELESGVKIGLWHIVEKDNFFDFLVHNGEVDNIRHPIKRLEYFASRALVNIVHPQITIEDIIKQGRQSILKNKAGFISFSHQYPFAAFAYHPTLHIGVDIHLCKEQVIRVKHKFLDDREWLDIQHTNNILWFINIYWAIKEAIYKAYYNDVVLNFKNDIFVCEFDITSFGEWFVVDVFVKGVLQKVNIKCYLKEHLIMVSVVRQQNV